MQRREFIKSACSLSLLVGSGISLSGLTSCASLPVYKTTVKQGKISVPVSLFADAAVQIVRPENYGYDIAVVQGRDGTYTALLLRCTHANNQLNFTGSGFRCPLHGSTFETDGSVTHGPAQAPLEQLKTDVENTVVVVEIG